MTAPFKSRPSYLYKAVIPEITIHVTARQFLDIRRGSRTAQRDLEGGFDEEVWEDVLRKVLGDQKVDWMKYVISQQPTKFRVEVLPWRGDFSF